jgi:hypothetical protein
MPKQCQEINAIYSKKIKVKIMRKILAVSSLESALPGKNPLQVRVRAGNFSLSL